MYFQSPTLFIYSSYITLLVFSTIPSFAQINSASNASLLLQTGHAETAWEIEMSPSEDYFLTLGDRQVFIWDTKKGNKINQFTDHMYVDAAFLNNEENIRVAYFYIQYEDGYYKKTPRIETFNWRNPSRFNIGKMKSFDIMRVMNDYAIANDEVGGLKLDRKYPYAYILLRQHIICWDYEEDKIMWKINLRRLANLAPGELRTFDIGQEVLAIKYGSRKGYYLFIDKKNGDILSSHQIDNLADHPESYWLDDSDQSLLIAEGLYFHILKYNKKKNIWKSTKYAMPFDISKGYRLAFNGELEDLFVTKDHQIIICDGEGDLHRLDSNNGKLKKIIDKTWNNLVLNIDEDDVLLKSGLDLFGAIMGESRHISREDKLAMCADWEKISNNMVDEIAYSSKHDRWIIAKQGGGISIFETFFENFGTHLSPLPVISAFLYIPQKDYLITGMSDGDLCIWNLQSASLIKRVQGDMGKIEHIQQINDSTILVGTRPGITYQLSLVSFVTNELDATPDWLVSSAISPDGQLLAYINFAGEIKLWSMPRHISVNVTLPKLNFGSPEGLFSAKVDLFFLNQHLLGVIHDNQITIYDLTTSEHIFQHRAKYTIENFDYNPLRNYLAWSDAYFIYIMDLTNQQEIWNYFYPPGMGKMPTAPECYPSLKFNKSGTQILVCNGVVFTTYDLPAKKFLDTGFISEYASGGSPCMCYIIDELNMSVIGMNGPEFNLVNNKKGEKYDWIENSFISRDTLLSFVSFGENEDYIINAINRGNYYKTNKQSLDNFIFRDEKRTYSMDQYDLIFNRPHLVLDFIGLASKESFQIFQNAYIKRMARMGFSEESFEKIQDIPQLDIPLEQFHSNTTNPEISIPIKATGNKNSLDRINVWVNGVPVYGRNGLSIRNRQLTTLDTILHLTLSAGRNLIEISAHNFSGIESVKENITINYIPTTPQRQFYIVTIGVSSFEQTDWDLIYPIIDAQAITHLFTEHPDTSIQVKLIELHNENFNTGSMNQLREKLMQTKVDDQVIVYIGTHGLPDDSLNYYLATSRTDFNKPRHNSITYDHLDNILDGIPARQKLLLVDACNAGEIDKESVSLAKDTNTRKGAVNFRSSNTAIIPNQPGIQYSFELMNQLFADLRYGTGTSVIASASGVEDAQEGTEWNHSVFTYSLIKGLKERAADLNGDGEIVVSELQRYLASNVAALTKGKQQPTFRVENQKNDWRVW